MREVLRLRPVGIAGPVMQLRVVAIKLHISGAETHFQMQLGIIGKPIEHFERLRMGRCQAHCAIKPLSTVDILALILGGEFPIVPGQRRAALCNTPI